MYLVNDVMDRESDRRHPLKRFRPIAAGEVSVATALATASLMGAVALGAAYALSPAFALVSAGYLGLQVLYSGPLKHIVIIDVLTIAIGFVLRAVGRRRRD